MKNNFVTDLIQKALEKNATELDLSSKVLTSFPSEIFQLNNLTSLVLDDNQLKTLPPEIARLSNLTSLSLDGNQLTSLPPAIGQLSSLTSLSLDGNQLTSLPPEIIRLSNLTSFSLNGNQLTSLPSEIFQLNNLTSLVLDDNQLKTLPPEIVQLSNLTSLSLDGNQLTSLPSAIVQLSSLTSLSLSYNRLTSLPPEVLQLSSLTSLSLSSNRLTSLPPEIGQLNSLASLSLSFNRLTNLPPEITQLNSLTSLSLSFNRLDSLPPEIFQLSNLTSLSLDGFQLTGLPPEIGQLSSLTSLSLNNNQLTSLPPEILQLSNLTSLSLDDNQLTSLPPEIGQLSSLSSLSLNNNQLTSLPPEIGQLSSLTSLSLNKNQLTSLPPEIGQLSSLTSLSLDGVQLTSLPPEILQLSSLTSLSLDGIQLTSLPPEIGQLSSLTSLSLNNNQLTSLPPEILQLSSLSSLSLDDNQLTSLPPEVFQLSSLTSLSLKRNQLTSLPPEILQLSSLTSLSLDDNQLTSLPPEVFQLSSLTSLSLDGVQLTSLPPEILQLSSLTSLSLNKNQLTSLPPEVFQLSNLTSLSLDDNQLTSLPPEVFQLSNLTSLSLDDNQLTSLPPEVFQLSNLTSLSLDDNQLTSLPPEIGQLNNLTWLSLDNNQLTSLPPEVFQINSLTSLSLDGNQLTSLPPQIVQLSNLTWLSLNNNQLTNLPSEIGQLNSLDYLFISENQLTDLPSEIGRLNNLDALFIGGNQLTSLPPEIVKINILIIQDNPFTKLPPEIVEQGSDVIIKYLRELAENGEAQWVSKLMLVGEGGVGKTSLLRALRGETFVKGEVTTRGIEIHPLTMAHPEHPENVKVTFNAWDFGGQEIYHATHQFFLTNRSLFLLLWNARAGYEQGKLYYWLDAIQARAPQSPVLVVATNTAERSADLPIAELKNRFPQIIDAFSIDNETGDGIPKLRVAIEKAAATSLPLMGEKWPASWLNAANEVRSRNEKHITPENLHAIFESHKVSKSSISVLERWLHELGDILYFRDESELNDLVVLKPSWVTQYISRVLDSDDVVGKEGIFTNTHMANLWSDLDPSMRQHFLRLMEKFDLSYRTLDNQEVSLIVERLPLDPPDISVWEELAKSPYNEISMKFRLSSILPGIPTWFIAREHRFTTHTHWRMGALFKRDSHYALVQAFPHDRYVQIAVRGSRPHEFFALLRDGLETTFKRYPGLKIERVIPCTGHDGQPCSYEFSFENLEKAIEREKPIDHIQCQQSFDDVSVPELLFGLHWRTQDKVLEKIDELKSQMTTQNNELVKLVQREFAKNFRREQAVLESFCPSVFVLRPYSAPEWSRIAFGAKMELQLYCQAPGCWHPTQDSGKYIFDTPPGWLRVVGKHIVNMVKFLKYVMPLAGPWAGMASAEYSKLIANDIKMMEALVKIIPDVSDLEGTTKLKLAEGITRSSDNSEEIIEHKENPYLRYEGSPLRAMRLLLDELDKQQNWGGLQRILTPEDDYLWLCEYHAKEYRY